MEFLDKLCVKGIERWASELDKGGRVGSGAHRKLITVKIFTEFVCADAYSVSADSPQ